MDKHDIPFLSVAELGELIRQREVSPVEATAAYLDRIDSAELQVQLVPHRLPQRGDGRR